MITSLPAVKYRGRYTSKGKAQENQKVHVDEMLDRVVSDVNGCSILNIKI